MTVTKTSVTVTTVVSEETRLTLEEISTICCADPEQLAALVGEGVLDPVAGSAPQDWRFSGATLSRARLALRLSRDFELSPAGAALTLQLLDEIRQLRARLRR
ncbi:MAG: chaperone modulator CbpM [Burkholderiaceae bacterium]